MTTIKAVIFDCFGVLYVDVKESLLKSIPPEQVQDLRDIYYQNDYGMLDHDEYLAAVASVTGRSIDDIQNFTAQEHRFNQALGDYITSELHPTYKVGLLSNIGRGWINSFFDMNQLHGLFDAIVLSGEEGITKPHPHIFEIMAERIGVLPAECVMIDDIAANCEGAEMAGMQAIHYTSNQQVLRDLRMMLAE